ncbi:MAG: hydroxyacylglutathione hydrolase [Planctomycetota bacterium]|jgi:hydroxyacylglutathione hydrolase
MSAASLEYWIYPVTPFAQNTTLLRCAETGRGALVDPGDEVDRLMAAVEEHDVELESILLTHGHIDHAGGTAGIVKRTGLPVVGPHREDLFWLEGMEQQAQMFGLPVVDSPKPDRWLVHGDEVTVGAQTLQVLFTPGHTPGHVVFFHEPSRMVMVGDVLFDGSIGRTDFPKGDHATLMCSIFETLLPLGDDVTFLPGHGPTSTLGAQRKSNPYLLPGPA